MFFIYYSQNKSTGLVSFFKQKEAKPNKKNIFEVRNTFRSFTIFWSYWYLFS